MFKTILVPLDSAQLSERVMQAVQSLQLSPATQVILGHVIPTYDQGLEQPADLPSTTEPPVDLYRHIEDQLQGYRTSLACASQIEIVTGDPAEEIIRLAHIHHADLIVIGSRGLTGVTRILEGSVSNQVVSEAPCSVMVVR
ncbi:MAG: universal stress protein [Acaryochloridaceae cyanobacterium SU_2_1]|nr:universal stress protein [Acaryochloridaceae cyanobacterium SU_2_1]NJM95741.1 universal stress protein [Acaryochloridaceae cyanobacterium CSU_5_19]